MKKIKIVSALTAAVLSLASLPVVSASAEEAAFLPGDVDNDGYITGHDAALISRSLLEEDFSLTEDELSRADITGDGIVDEADAVWIYYNQEYKLGDVDLDGTISTFDAWHILKSLPTFNATEPLQSELQRNLADTNADRAVAYIDFYGVLNMGARLGACYGNPFDTSTSQYCFYSNDRTYSNTSHALLGDVDGDGVLTDHDAILAAKSVTYDDVSNYPDFGMGYTYSLGLGDINFDGVMDQTDSEWIHAHAQYVVGDLQKNGSAGDLNAAYYALKLYATQSAGYTLTITENDQEGIVFCQKKENSVKIGQLDYHLLDANADGYVNMEDAILLLTTTANIGVGNSYESVYRNYLLS